MTTLGELRRFTAARTFFPPTTLKRALGRFGFVQADPIRAPARAQDLVLRHRVKGYRAGNLETQYEKLGVSEDFFINYGFVTAELSALMHPRPDIASPWPHVPPWPAERLARAREYLAFVKERGTVHPREVDAHFAHGKVKNYWGGSSNATTHLLDQMHYRGLLRVVRREGGVRLYAVHEHTPHPDDPASREARLDALVDAVVRIYAPLTTTGLGYCTSRLRHGAPQFRDDLRAAQRRAKARLSHAKVEGVDWYWPVAEKPEKFEPDEVVRFLAPFDPVVQDRKRYEALWGWEYRFEAYTPAPKRKLGYYALPVLWREQVIGWANVAVKDGKMQAELGYVAGKAPREAAYRRELEAEVERMREFLGLAAR